VDVVYVCRKGENEELRYSLRSLANLPHTNVWVVGGAPDWYTGNLIKVKQQSTKYRNVRANLRAVVNCDDISDEFVLFNDDFFVVQPVDSVPYYHGGDLLDKIKRYENYSPNSVYVRMLWDTLHVLAYHGSPTSYDYALHVPMRMHREMLGPLLPYDCSTRILYGNLFRVEGVQVDDVKVHSKPVDSFPKPDVAAPSFPFLSTSDGTFNRVKNRLLKRMFLEPSPYERT
jgi:hypothetical protein